MEYAISTPAAFSRSSYDAVIVGSGPNGLAAAITITQTGRSVLVIEAQEEIGGGTRSAELTLPGFLHDVCSAVHPMGIASPFFRSLPLEKHGLEWIHPSAPVAHPLDSGAVLIERSVEETASKLGADAERYVNLFRPMVADWSKLERTLLGPPRLPHHPLAAGRFALSAWRSAYDFARRTFKEEGTRAAFAGMAAHSIVPLENLTTAAFGLVFTLTAHAVGWPIARGGSRSIARALASYLQSLGGEIVTGFPIVSLDQLPKFRAALFDITPRQLLRIDGLQFPAAFRQNLQRFRYGPGVCKVDWALDAPIPWKFPECARAGTVHIGGTLDEVAASERAPWQGTTSATPFVLLAQPTLFDPSRAPAGKHIAWAYAHVPHGSNLDISNAIENQIERFARGFRNRVLQRHVMLSSDMERHNANLVGGDIAGGAALASQLLLRPTWRTYSTPRKDIYLCSSSTPPGAGVHGLCGYFAALKALETL